MTELDRLLRRLADGDETIETLERARALLGVDARLPPDLREIGLDDDDPAVAASALLGVLGLDDGLFGGLLGDALRFEAGPAESEATVTDAAPHRAPLERPDDDGVSEAMLLAQEAAGLPPVAEAVRAEAGEIDIDIAVVHAIGGQTLPVGDAISALAGEADVSAEVAVRMGALPAPLSAAVRSESGSIDIADAVAPAVVEVAAALRAESGSIDIAAAVLTAIGALDEVPVGPAVRTEAGTVEVWGGMSPAFETGWVSGLLDHELPAVAHRIAARRLMADPQASAELAAFADQGRSIRAGIRDEAGEAPYVWGPVAKAIGIDEPEAVPGWDGALLAEAVRAEAGPVRIEMGVMDRIRRTAEAVAPLQTPTPANDPRRWQWVGLALAATVLLGVLVGRLIPGGGMVDVTGPTASHSVVDFASAGEVEVQELSYDEDIEVIMTLPDESGERPLIIRINEEA